MSTSNPTHTSHAVCTSHPNIALVKYWGKENIPEITPIHGSLSVTLNFGVTTTKAEYSSDDVDHFYLNNKEAEITSRLKTAIDFFNDNGTLHFNITSVNSFPTAAGLASSAAGAAAFVGALASLVGKTNNPITYWMQKGVDLTALARKVSGSGCRSIHGGFVEWVPGTPSESVAKQIADQHQWEDFVVFSVIVSSKKKDVLSTKGMQSTVETVPWIHWRAQEVVPKRISDAKKFINEKDFASLAEIIMRESNELHANCLATFPPIKYLNDESFKVVSAIHQLNDDHKINIAAYSFDAGPNPFVFTTKEHEKAVLDKLHEIGIEESSITRATPCEGITCTYNE